MTDQEINQCLLRIQKDLENNDFHDVFLFAKKKIEEYPNCESLIWQAAVILDANRMAKDIPNRDNYDAMIFEWYERCLHSEDERIRNHAADALFHAYMRKNDYKKAAQYLDYFSWENPERKRKEALVKSKMGKRAEAYRAYEELIFSGYQHLQMTLNSLRNLYMEDDNHEMAKDLVEVSSSVAATFEMGKYHVACGGLDVAAWEKDIARTLQLTQEILDDVGTIFDFTKSRLYQHMLFNQMDPDFPAKLKQEFLRSLEDETFRYMQGNKEWEKIRLKSVT